MSKLTDQQKQKIIADYIETQNYSKVARMNNISDTSVANIVKDNKEISEKLELKKQQTTQTMLEMIDNTSNERLEAISELVKAINSKAKSTDMFTNVRDLAMAYGTLVDKEFKFKEMQKEIKKQLTNSPNDYRLNRLSKIYNSFLYLLKI